MTNFENQQFDNLSVNLYEVVIAASKLAREINKKVRNSPEEAVNIRPTSLALELVLNPSTQFTYEEPVDENENET